MLQRREFTAWYYSEAQKHYSLISNSSTAVWHQCACNKSRYTYSTVSDDENEISHSINKMCNVPVQTVILTTFNECIETFPLVILQHLVIFSYGNRNKVPVNVVNIQCLHSLNSEQSVPQWWWCFMAALTWKSRCPGCHFFWVSLTNTTQPCRSQSAVPF